MPIATLIAPTDLTLDRVLVDAMQRALDGGELVWLSESRAVEFSMKAGATLAQDLRDGLTASRVDFAVQPDGTRRKRLLLADMDSTLIHQECIDEVAAAVGVGDAVSEITKRAMNGEIDFSGALKERVALLAGKPATVIDEVLSERITYMPGGAVLVSTMRAHGAYTALVSGGFTQFASVVAARLGFDEHRANSLVIDRDTLTGDVAEPILGRDAKVEALQELTARLGIAASDAAAVGDGANDIGMLQAAGLGVALHAKPAVQEAAKISVNYSDLSALLYLQGYSDDEFAAV